MIEYSVYMTTNHLSKDEGAKAYAAAQIREKLGTDKFVAHVARHNSVFSKGTIKGVLADVACCVREQLLNGNKVHSLKVWVHSVSPSAAKVQNR